MGSPSILQVKYARERDRRDSVEAAAKLPPTHLAGTRPASASPVLAAANGTYSTPSVAAPMTAAIPSVQLATAAGVSSVPPTAASARTTVRPVDVELQAFLSELEMLEFFPVFEAQDLRVAGTVRHVLRIVIFVWCRPCDVDEMA